MRAPLAEGGYEVGLVDVDAVEGGGGGYDRSVNTCEACL